MINKFGACYCIYDDHEYLEISLKSIVESVDIVLFLISNVPWNGTVCDNRETINKIKDLCSKYSKCCLMEGCWTNEIDQRNFGLKYLFSLNIDYCFVIDSDEIYYKQHFKNIIELINQNPNYDAFHLEWNTYWTKQYYVISPREGYQPLICVKVANFVFTIIRGGKTRIRRLNEYILNEKNNDTYNAILIPQQIAICFHLSYARSNDYIKRKLETNSHAKEFIPDWYNTVWSKWTPESKNLHPVTPHQYQRAVKEDFAIFPENLKIFIKNERNVECSIIILNWNSTDFLFKCLDAIIQHTKRKIEIIIVDNGSKDLTDNFEEYIKNEYTTKLIMNKENLGFAAGVNQGIRIAKKENDICLLNVDAEVTENWLDHLYETLNENANAGLVGPLGNEIENKHQSVGMTDKDIKQFNIYFYCVLIYRELINKIGLLDERFGLGGYEDNDYCIRAQLAGYEPWISAKSLVKHKAHQIFEKNKVDRISLETENERKLTSKLVQAFYHYASKNNIFLDNELSKLSGLKID
jgi:GT2 family glycosyltransferase